MKVRICHMTSAHNSDDIRIFQKECVSLAKNKSFQIFLVAPGVDRLEKNVQVIGVKERPKSRLKRFLFYSKRVYEEALKINADIYHFHDPELMPYALKLKKKGKKVIFDSHEYTYSQIMTKSYIPIILRKLIAGLYKNYEDSVCRKIDAVIFPCTIRGKHPFTNVTNKPVIIGNLPDLKRYSPEETVKEFDAFYAGSLTQSRGITEFLEGAKIASAKVALAGNFSPPEYKEDLLSQGLLDGVQLLGYITHDQVINYLKSSKCCVSNIKNIGQYALIDNLPTKIYEAMAMELPVIISNFSYPKKLNAELEFALLTDPSNALEIGKALKKIMNDEEYAKRLGRNGRKLIEKYFDWNNDVSKLENLYIDLRNEG